MMIVELQVDMMPVELQVGMTIVELQVGIMPVELTGRYYDRSKKIILYFIRIDQNLLK